jgi:hypothetical protein
VALDPATVTALRVHRTRQLEERLAMGGDYQDQDLVVCHVDGTPIHPKTISYQFGKAARAAGSHRSACTTYGTRTRRSL